MYVHEKFFYTERPNLYKQSRFWDAQFVDIYGPSIPTKITVGNIYRPPRGNNDITSIETFTSELKPPLTQLRREDSYTVLCGDFNINLLKLNRDSAVTNFFEFLCDSDFTLQDLPSEAALLSTTS